MANRWFPADYCPKNAQCSLEDGLSPSNGIKIQSISFPNFPDPIEGEIRAFSNENSSPVFHAYKWMKCEGQLLEILEHTKMFSILGDGYGGDARLTFGLPDLRMDGEASYYICMNGEMLGFMDF